MGIEPEQVLEQERIAAESGIEDAEVQSTFSRDHHDSYGDNRSTEKLNDAGGIVRPDEQRKARPRHAGCAHAVNGNYEVQAGKDGRESDDEDCESGFDDFRVGKVGAEGGVERPTSIDASGQHAVQHHDAADDVEIPAQQVDAGKGEILGANHQGHEEISEHSGNGWDQEEENHDHSMHGEKLVVSVGLDEVAGGRKQLEADEQGKKSANEKEKRDRDEIEQGDAFVVGGEQPRPDAVLLVQVGFTFDGLRDRDLHTHCT